jgi:hypothetical protein
MGYFLILEYSVSAHRPEGLVPYVGGHRKFCIEVKIPWPLTALEYAAIKLEMMKRKIKVGVC